MNKLVSIALVSSVFALGLGGCSKKDEVAGGPGVAPQAAANSGKIVQLQNAAGYTYAEVEAGGQRVWMAGAQINAKAGDMVQWGNHSEMRNFNARSLNRVFDRILFVDNWGLVGGPAVAVAPHGAPGSAGMVGAAPGGMAGGHPPMPGYPPAASAWQAPGGGAPAAAPAAARNGGQVKTVLAAGGYTYLEVAQAGGLVWVAVPETPVTVGATVAWDGGSVMRNFNARSLNRTFDSIIFANAVSVVR